MHFLKNSGMRIYLLPPLKKLNIVAGSLNHILHRVKEDMCLIYLAHFKLNGIRARALKVAIFTQGNFPNLIISIENSKYVKVDGKGKNVAFYITEDIYFDKYLLFKFLYNWVKTGDNTTLYCDTLDHNQSSQFVKPNWDATYNIPIPLLPPIYLESTIFTSLKPKKLELSVGRPVQKQILQAPDAGASPRIPHLRLPIVPKSKHQFSVVVPTANKRLFIDGKEKWLIRDFIEEINSTSTFRLPEIVVVHNSEMSLKDQKLLQNYSNVKLILCLQKSLNLSRKINMGVKFAGNEDIIISNDDVRHKSANWLDGLLGWLQVGATGVVGPKIFYESGLLQYAGVELDQGVPKIIGYTRLGNSVGMGFSYVIPREVRAVTGVLMGTKKSIYTKVGGWDSRFAINYNDIDYCLRVSALGYKVIFEPRAEIYHLESASRDLQLPYAAEENLLRARHGEVEPLWRALISDSATESLLSFNWQEKYLD